ncbi:RluA family pseudouridine synthase [Colwellia sp. KU-HH00111]|uniref:RluA family pseudouridine synthase n=1 Tax=Colwellia sp. KU-HH00111 TaxID=3127652 RepID=UPI003105B870
MINQQRCFTPFTANIEHYTLPKRFTFPFCYHPHPLCLVAAEQLQQQLQSDLLLEQSLEQNGKMFGVLVVRNQQNELGYLSAFSGQQLPTSHQINFVPPVFELDAKTDFFHAENKIINRLNRELEALIANPELAKYQQSLSVMLEQQAQQLSKHRNQMTLNRQVRKVQRSQAKNNLTGDDLALQLKQLAQQSVDDKNQLRDIKAYWADLIAQIQQQLTALTDEIDEIKKKRKQRSTKLQKKLFKQYRLLNRHGVEKDLIELFEPTAYPIPPAGAGDCAAPKLLQYAFKQQYQPVAMAEFWWGKAPKSEIRQHKNFYGACSGKCQPILPHMLDGMAIDENPLLLNPAQGKNLEIVYQDDAIVVVNKPNEFLSVPGKNIEDSVYARIKQQFPEATGSLIVHRLDMSTSGLMVLALTQRAQKSLQQQFIKRQIKKRYVAILAGSIASALAENQGESVNEISGELNLPLRGDLDDRPRQLVCFEHGKASRTYWEVIETVNKQTRMYLYPETGRTHQLRVHCAHPNGLNTPILGDDLYGRQDAENKDQRLHLHAQRLILHHPITKEVMTFEVDADF